MKVDGRMDFSSRAEGGNLKRRLDTLGPNTMAQHMGSAIDQATLFLL